MCVLNLLEYFYQRVKLEKWSHTVKHSIKSSIKKHTNFLNNNKKIPEKSRHKKGQPKKTLLNIMYIHMYMIVLCIKNMHSHKCRLPVLIFQSVLFCLAPSNIFFCVLYWCLTIFFLVRIHFFPSMLTAFPKIKIKKSKTFFAFICTIYTVSVLFFSFSRQSHWIEMLHAQHKPHFFYIYIHPFWASNRSYRLRIGTIFESEYLSSWCIPHSLWCDACREENEG